jgi:hypothetical protein
MIDIVSFLPGKRKRTSSGWISFNAPCCVHRGENQDKRMRGGLKLDGDNWNFHCFNCGYTASFILGRSLSFKSKNLLKWLGVDSEQIDLINIESLKHKTIDGLLHDKKPIIKFEIEFEDRELPENLVLVTEQQSLQYEYLKNRHIPMNYPFMTNTSASRTGIVIPFTYDNRIVGNCTRFLDDKVPKYINDMQQGYVFGTDLQQDNWEYVIVVEGIFDALAINGVAVLHNAVNSQQIEIIKSLSRKVILVPDQDRAGMNLVDQALELGWSVSMPDWGADVKDVNDAVIKYGRLATLMMIMESQTNNKIKIEIRKKQIGK